MDDPLTILQKKKEPFLNAVQADIRSYIVSRGSNCIAVVEKNDDEKGTIYTTWRPGLDSDLKDFCKRLYLFVRHKKHRGRTLDSALTEPICDIVTKRYESFYEESAVAIGEGLLARLKADSLVLDSFVSKVTDKALDKATKEVRKRVAHMIVTQIHDSATHGAMHTIGDQIGQVAATTAGSQIAAIVAHMLMKLMAAHIGSVIAHILASTVIHKLLMLLVKKVVVGAVVTAVVNFLAVHVGAAVGGSTIMFIILPLLAAYLVYKIATFPEKIGNEVSKSVRAKLSERFDSMNKDILDKIYDRVFNGEDLVLAIAKDKEFQKILEGLADEM